MSTSETDVCSIGVVRLPLETTTLPQKQASLPATSVVGVFARRAGAEGSPDRMRDPEAILSPSNGGLRPSLSETDVLVGGCCAHDPKTPACLRPHRATPATRLVHAKRLSE